MNKYAAASVLLLMTGAGRLATAATIDVPTVQPTIQAAIDVAVAGDVVMVAPGTYFENLNFKGKAITVRSLDPMKPEVVNRTIIDGQLGGSVVRFASNEGTDSVLAGFVITNGFAPGGAGIQIDRSSPTIFHCVITDNIATNLGGGILAASQSEPVIRGCIVQHNIASNQGGGIASVSSSKPIIAETLVCGNAPDQIVGPFDDVTGNTFSAQCNTCPADLDGNGVVNFADLVQLLGAWGPYQPCPPLRPEDLDGSCAVDFGDVVVLLGRWGACP